MWESVYAYANYWQKCTACNKKIYPEWMEELQYSVMPNLNKPHRSELCQRCISGRSCRYQEPSSAPIAQRPRMRTSVVSHQTQKTSVSNVRPRTVIVKNSLERNVTVIPPDDTPVRNQSNEKSGNVIMLIGCVAALMVLQQFL